LARFLKFRLLVPLLRSPHPPEFTARGVGIGVFWGLTPTLGLQTMEILATWYFFKRVLRRDASLLQALVWVWVNNPLTMVPMFYAFYVTGLLLTGDPGTVAAYDAFVAQWNAPDPSARFVDRTIALVTALGVPTLLGSLPWAALGAWVSYRWTLRLVARRRLRIASS
jgi:uncharacterized protein (DUF2062 family)